MVMNKKKSTIITTVIMCVAVIVCGIILFLTRHEISALQKQAKENDVTIKELKEQFANISVENEETVEEIQVKLNSASSAGTRVADLQNMSRNIDMSSSDWEEQSLAISEEMRTYLEDTSKATDWYYGSPKLVKCHWEFESTYSSTGNDIPVVWTCRNEENGELLGYAIATYHADTGKFGDLDYNMTMIGSGYVSAG